MLQSIPPASPPPSFIARRSEADEVTIALEGVFDGASAWDLRHALDAVEAGTKRVVLDFTRVREFYDFGVAVLAHALAERPQSLPAVAFLGLRTHQTRLLSYFGVKP